MCMFKKKNKKETMHLRGSREDTRSVRGIGNDVNRAHIHEI